MINSNVWKDTELEHANPIKDCLKSKAIPQKFLFIFEGIYHIHKETII